jgi:hypothetical protein
MFENYTPKQLRDAVEIELKLCEDVKQATYNAMAQLKKNPAHYEDMQKARSHKYVRREPDGKGGWTYWYVKPGGVTEKFSLIDTIKNMFHLSDKNEASEKLKKDYLSNQISAKYNITFPSWMFHVSEYLNNKIKWDNFLSQKKAGQDAKVPSGDGSKPSDKKQPEDKKQSQVMQVKPAVMIEVQKIYGSPSSEPEKIEDKEPTVELPAQPSEENNFSTMPDKESTEKVQPLPGNSDDIVSKFERWKSGDLTGIEGQKFEYIQQLSGKVRGKIEQQAFNEIVTIKNIANGFVSYLTSGGSGGSMISAFIDDMKSGLAIPVGYKAAIDTDEGSKVETNQKTTPPQDAEAAKSDEELAREGYFNEKPAEVLNVGKDVWGAARHNYDTYQKTNADLTTMEYDGTATAFVTKKSLIGDYGLADKDARMAKGESAHKILASFAIREYLKKVPMDDAISRLKYQEFCRAIIRLDRETSTARDFYSGLGASFAQIFNVPTKESTGNATGMLRDANNINSLRQMYGTVGGPISILMLSLSGHTSRGLLYDLNAKERSQMTNLANIMLGEDPLRKGSEGYSYDDIRTSILGVTRASSIKVKKGDTIHLTEKIKEDVYITQRSFANKEDGLKSRQLQDKWAEYSYDYDKVYDGKTHFEEVANKYGFPLDGDKIQLGRILQNKKEEAYTEFSNHKKEKTLVSKIYPESDGQVSKAGQKTIVASFKFPDGKIRAFEIDPQNLTAESVDAVKRNAEKKVTAKLNLFIEKKVSRKGGSASFDNKDIADIQKTLQDDFKFKAIQYGNSMPDDERKFHTKWTAEAFSDLKDITGLPMSVLTANGKLGIAFGARGQNVRIAGEGAAAAHYEPSSKMINLTRGNGFGSLAHEWGHFMDNILSSRNASGGFVSGSPDYQKKSVLYSEMKHGYIREIEGRRGVKVRYFYDTKAPDSFYPFAKLTAGQFKPDATSNYVKFRDIPGQQIEVMEPVNSITHELASSIAELSEASLVKQGTEALKTTPSDSQLYDNINSVLGSDYWRDHQECFARAFECYISDKLAEKGQENTYLVSGRRTKDDEGTIVYPQGEERKKINALFDKFIAHLKESGELQKAVEKLNKRIILVKRINRETGKTEYRRKM